MPERQKTPQERMKELLAKARGQQSASIDRLQTQHVQRHDTPAFDSAEYLRNVEHLSKERDRKLEIIRKRHGLKSK